MKRIIMMCGLLAFVATANWSCNCHRSATSTPSTEETYDNGYGNGFGNNSNADEEAAG